MIQLRINGQQYAFEGDPETPLLWYLRDELGLKGTKFGCGVGICGICTLLIDGEANHACMVPVRKAQGHDITTIEGLVAKNHALLHTWIRRQVPQCGYCQPGQIMAAAALLNQHPHPSDEQINQAMSPVLCRCGTYQRIRAAIHDAAKLTGYPLPAQELQYRLPVASEEQTGADFEDWIRITEDGTVTVTINHSDMGQGSTTGLAMLLAEELDVDLAHVQFSFAPVAKLYRNPLFNEQTTGGSSSIRGEWERLRLVGARTRWRLMQAAAQHWGVHIEECRTHNGCVLHDTSRQQLSYGELARDAEKIHAPERVPIKDPMEYRLVGRSQPRLELPAMVTGHAVYGADVFLPDLLYASVARLPSPDARMRSMNADAAKAVTGVIDVINFEIGVAVLAQTHWAAIQGREQMQVSWEETAKPDANNASYDAQLLSAAEQKARTVKQQGNVKRALREAQNIIEATYATSYLAHAPLEPMNCTAMIKDGHCDVWVGTQSQEGAQATAAQHSRLAKNQVNIHSTFLGGGFGRRLETDYVADAVALARITGNAVQVLWNRGDDIQHDFYRPAHVTVCKAALDQRGWPTAWWQRSVGHDMALTSTDVPYTITNYTEEQLAVASPLPVGAWRSVAPGQNAFVVESFIDELAHAAGVDPLAYRLALLQHSPRSQAVLQLAADKAGWHSKLPQGHYHGIAQYQSFGSWAAQVAEVSVEQDQIRVHRVVCAIDCGQCVNPDAVRAQIEGAVAMGVSAALKEKILFENGKVTQATYTDYPILTFAEMPKVEVHIVPSHEPPGGVGEPALPPMAPAIGNAVFAATQKRLRQLPFIIR
jgi:isoquinoline 1-oxidoreductase beta subunit